MATADFQRALADITLDVRLASAVCEGRAGALDPYDLTDRERRRLEAVSRQAGMSLTCSLARANRFGVIHDAFPMTCVLLGPELKVILNDLWSTRQPDNYQLSGEEAPFAALVESRLETGTLRGEYLEEIYQYERACWEMAMATRVRRAADGPDPHRTLRFRHDPAALLDALARHEAPPAGLPAGDHVVTVRVVGGDLRAEWDAPAESGAASVGG